MPPSKIAKKISRASILVSVIASSLLLSVPSAAISMELDLQVEVGVGTTDNINRASDSIDDPTISEKMASAGIDIELSNQSARSDVQLRGSASYVDYIDGTYDSEVLPGLDATAVFRISQQALRWFFQGNIGQATVNPFQPVTPENREDVTYLTTGPSILLPFGSRFSMGLDAWYSLVDYEVQDLDNSRTGARLAFIRSLSSNRSVSLNMTRERTEFDLDDLYDPYDRSQVYLSLETEGARNQFVFDVGWSRSESGDSEFDSPLANFEWRRNVSPATTLTLNLGTNISDAADTFRGDQQVADNIGSVHNQQAIADPYRHDYARFDISYDRQRTGVTISLAKNKENYEENNQFDRTGYQAHLDISRQLGGSWSIGLFGDLSQFEYEYIGRDDDESSFGLNIVWSRFRTLEFELRAERHEQDSSDETAIYTENRAYLTVRYIPDFGS